METIRVNEETSDVNYVIEVLVNKKCIYDNNSRKSFTLIIV